MESYSTAALPAARRALAWNELYSTRLASVDFVPADRFRFHAELKLGVLGPIGIARMVSDRTSIDRTPDHIARSPRRLFSFVLQVRGTGVFVHCGHEARLEPGDFALCDSTVPHSYRVGDGSDVIMLRVPPDVLRAHLPSPERLCGRRLAASEGISAMAAAMTLSLCDRLEAELAPDFQDRVARHVLDVMATSYTMAFGSGLNGSAVTSGRHARVTRYIEEHLRDRDLSPCSIADELNISPRYLRRIFALQDEPASAYILRRRLEECARQIADPSWRGHTITELAFGWGFNSAAYFTRSFRARFGLSPREYRRARIG